MSTAAPAGGKIAFIGLGAMGYHMAGHLATYGDAPPLTVWNRTRAMSDKHAAEFASSEVTVADTVREAAAGASFVFICLPDSDVVSAVVNDIADVVQAGAVVVDCTSGDPAKTRDIADVLDKVGACMVDAPISGGPAGAQKAILTTMVGGKGTAVASATPFLSTFCKVVKHMGEAPGSGHATKAINNALNTSHLCMAAEGLIALQGLGSHASGDDIVEGKQRGALGVSPDRALAVINSSSGRSLQPAVRRPVEVLTGAFNYGFKVGLMLKDVRIANSIMRAQSCVFFLKEGKQ
jgi:3-hydroxyisobutyrate dehydrogenase